MKKKLHYFAFIIFYTFSASIPFFIKADVFDELFKNVDFNKLAEDMEKMFGKDDTQATSSKVPSIPSITPSYSGPEEKIIEPITTDKPKDMRSLFLNPDIQTVKTKEKTKKEPTKKSRESLSRFKQDMNENLKLLELNIEANKKLSPQFKEKYLPTLKEEADKIVIASELINSKKLYQKIFLSPPAVSTSSYSTEKSTLKPIPDLMKELRQRYLLLIDKINILNEKISISEEEESKEDDKEQLEEFASQKTQEIPQSEHLAPIDAKIRGLKPEAQKAPSKKIIWDTEESPDQNTKNKELKEDITNEMDEGYLK